MKVRLPKFANALVVIAGDVMLDRYLYGITSHISPEAPVPIVKINKIAEHPGGAANVAMNIAALGASSHLVGLIGEDEAGHILNKKLHDVKVKCELLVVKEHQTITKLRVLSRNQQMIRLDFGESFKHRDAELLQKIICQALGHTKVLVLSDYAKGTLNDIQSIIQIARKKDILVLIDPKGNCFERYRGATLLTPNFSEFEAIVGKCKSESDIINCGMKLISNYDLCALLITRSEQGMTLLQQDKIPLHLPAQAREVFDVTGAGDTVIGVLATVLAVDRSIEEACFFANAAASVVVGKLGASTLSTIELENSINTSSIKDFGIMNKTQLKAIVNIARQRGEKIVMTNGIFDILHAGHVSYLADASKLGDRLIVALNSDESTKRIKGENRPVNSLENRMIVVGALESVDWVISFEEDTPESLITEILPDILVKGGDYQLQDVVGSKEIWENGGSVYVIHIKKNVSTTEIIKNIRGY